MMKKIFFLFLMLLFSMASMAQDFKIVSVESLPADMSAREEMKSDQTERQCALLRIATQNIPPKQREGFIFKTDLGSEMVERANRNGEIWLWVSPGLKYLRLMHRDLGQYELRLIDYVPRIESLHTYKIVIRGTAMAPIPEDEDLGGSYLMMTVEPKTAQVYIDDKPKTVENGEVKILLPYGRHTYRVESPNYMTEAGAIEIGHERKELNISLTSARATLTVNCADAEADIYINEEKKGCGSWTGQLDEGMYAVEARKAGHRTVKQSLTLAKQEQKVLTLNAPQPVYGKLNLDSSPGNCEVYLDGTKIGK